MRWSYTAHSSPTGTYHTSVLLYNCTTDRLYLVEAAVLVPGVVHPVAPDADDVREAACGHRPRADKRTNFHHEIGPAQVHSALLKHLRGSVVLTAPTTSTRRAPVIENLLAVGRGTPREVSPPDD
eukprot:9478776-Pyramimonas_sp.AAC.3